MLNFRILVLSIFALTVTACVPRSEYQIALEKIEQLERQVFSQAAELEATKLQLGDSTEHVALVVSIARKIRSGNFEEAIKEIELIEDSYVLDSDVKLSELALRIKSMKEIAAGLDYLRDYYGLSQNPTLNHNLVNALSIFAHVVSAISLALVCRMMIELMISRIERYVMAIFGSILMFSVVGFGSFGAGGIFSLIGGSYLSFVFHALDYVKGLIDDDLLYEIIKSFIVGLVLSHLFVTMLNQDRREFALKFVILLMFLQLGSVVLGTLEQIFAGKSLNEVFGIATFILTAFAVVLFHPKSKVRELERTYMHLKDRDEPS